MDRTIIHLDLDAFFVSIERKYNPKLCGMPLIVGGRSSRGVVAACSYEARKFGVKSAMPMYLARHLCPDAKILTGDMEAYSKESQLVTDIVADVAPLFEKASIDEFYIDASGMDRFIGSFQWAKQLKQTIYKESNLPISFGMSVNKLVSKVATGEFKPNAEQYIINGSEIEFLSPLPVDKIPMIGKQTATLLYEMGVNTVSKLREIPVKFLIRILGKNGESLWKKAHGIDDSPVVPFIHQKSISTESTFSEDTIDINRIKSILIAMVEKIMFQLRTQKKMTSCVAVKIRYTNFDTETRQTRIPYTSSDKVVIYTVSELFHKLYNRRRMIRLVGVCLRGLIHGNRQISLFEDTEQDINLLKASDYIKDKYGMGKLVRAITLDSSSNSKKQGY